MFVTLISAASAAAFMPWMTFSRSPTFEPEQIEVQVGTRREGDQVAGYELRRVIVSGRSKSIMWTDSMRCPAVRDMLIAAQKLEMPHVSVPWLERDTILVTGDGVGYRLSGSAKYNGESAYDFSIASNSETPLAKWVDESLRALEPCWTKHRKPEW